MAKSSSSSNSSGAKIVKGSSMAAASLLIASVIFVGVGLRSPWGNASFNIGGVISGQGHFTLWEIIVSSKIDFLSIVTPDAKFKLSETLCSSDDGDMRLAEVEAVCGRFSLMRAFTFVALLASIPAALCALAACADLLCLKLSPRTTRICTLLAAVCGAGASACALAALISAATMPRNDYLTDATTAGAGAVCMALVVVCAVSATALELACWCRLRDVGGAPGDGQKAVAMEGVV